MPALMTSSCRALLGLSASLCLSTAHALEAPLLKWQHGGCYNSWCETGWYSSPAVADLDGDGRAEVVASLSSVFALDGETGALLGRVASGHDISETGASSVWRTWPAVVISDIDGDGELEIITAHNRGTVSVYDHTGRFKPGWPKQPSDRELRSLIVDDIDGDGRDEIIVSAAVTSRINTWVYQHDGSLRPGWPQPATSVGSAWGVFNNNATTGDLDGDGLKEVIVPSDVTRVQAYHPDGSLMAAHPMYSGQTWGELSAWEDPEIEMRGWGTCSAGDARKERYRANFAYGAGEVVDMDGDGRMEVVVTGNMYDCAVGNDAAGNRYNTVFIFNADRSRYRGDKGDWSIPPIDTGAALSEDYNLIENNQPNPAVVDLDGDGIKEIVFPSYDGRMHALWLDKTEHHAWPYGVASSTEGFHRFASEAAVADLDGDGRAEIIFTTWTQKGSGQNGHLNILNHRGELLHKVALPASKGSSSWDGGLAAPTLANIDADDDLEVVVSTAHAGIVAFDLPGTASARVLWSNGAEAGRALQPPRLNATVAGTRVTLDWGAAPSAGGYELHYAPYPYTGEASIRALDLGRVTRAEYDLPAGFAYYVAVRSRLAGSRSGYSNIELVRHR